MLLKWFTVKSDTSFLFVDWDISTILGLSTALLVASLLAVLFETLSFYIQLRESTIQHQNGRYAFKAYIGTHCLLSAIHMVRLLSGYLLMMCIMSFNIWMLVSAVVGGGIGYLCSRPVINHCMFKYRNNYNIARLTHTQLIPARQGNSQDYLPLGLYFNTSDPWSNSTDKQNSVCEQELTMYVSVL